MVEKQEENEEGSWIGITIAITFMVVVGVFIYVTMANTVMCYECDRLTEEIDKKTNVSDDYRQGWLDCVSKLRSIRNEVTNVTNQFGLIGVK